MNGSWVYMTTNPVGVGRIQHAPNPCHFYSVSEMDGNSSLSYRFEKNHCHCTVCMNYSLYNQKQSVHICMGTLAVYCADADDCGDLSENNSIAQNIPCEIDENHFCLLNCGNSLFDDLYSNTIHSNGNNYGALGISIPSYDAQQLTAYDIFVKPTQPFDTDDPTDLSSDATSYSPLTDDSGLETLSDDNNSIQNGSSDSDSTDLSDSDIGDGNRSFKKGKKSVKKPSKNPRKKRGDNFSKAMKNKIFAMARRKKREDPKKMIKNIAVEIEMALLRENP